MLALRIGGGDQTAMMIMYVNIRLNNARQVVLQLMQGRTQHLRFCQRVGSGNLVRRQSSLGKSLLVKLALHRIPRQESGDQSRHAQHHHDGDAHNRDDLDLQTQAFKHSFYPGTFKLPLLMKEGNRRQLRVSAPYCPTTPPHLEEGRRSSHCELAPLLPALSL